jgi:hypothetical protein
MSKLWALLKESQYLQNKYVITVNNNNKTNTNKQALNHYISYLKYANESMPSTTLVSLDWNPIKKYTV